MSSADADGLLHKQERRQVPFAIPRVLSDRLDKLCALVNEQGTVGTVFRYELLSALLVEAPESVRELERLIGEYRKLTVRAAAVGDEKNANVIDLHPVKPGRRPA
jgi:hypothetical protein